MTLDPATGDSGRSARWNRLSLIIMGAGAVSLAAAAVLFALTLSGVLDDGDPYSGPDTITGPIGDIRDVMTPYPTATPAPVPPSEAPVQRILIPKFDVDAPVVVRGVDTNGVMETPDGAWDVAWYDFSARPGFGSNAVFSAHVDYINVGPAVFWNLRNLEENDIVEVRLEDGTTYRYEVFSKNQIYAADADVQEIVGSTPREVVTLITCGGTFRDGQYDQRVIVRAERIFDDGPGQAAGASASP